MMAGAEPDGKPSKETVTSLEEEDDQSINSSIASIDAAATLSIR
jgi:hypothetical protein